MNQTQRYVKTEYLLSEVTARIISAAQQVHRNLGPGFEVVFYQRALALEFPAQALDYSREVWIDVHYRDIIIGRKRIDFSSKKSWWKPRPKRKSSPWM